MNWKRLIQLFLILMTTLVCLSQDPQFSRFYSNAMYLAPSFTGISGANRFSMSYRNQWPEIKTGYYTYSAAYDHYFRNLHSGVGVLFLKDIAGSGNLSTTNIGLLYSFDFKVTNTIHIRPGMHLAYTVRSIDFEKLLWKDQMSAVGNSPVTGEVVSFDKTGDLDFSASSLVYGEYFWAGISVDHLTRPNQSLYEFEFEDNNFAKVPVKYQVFGGGRYIMKERLLRPIPTVLHFAFLYKKQAGFNQLDLGFYWYYDPLVLGIWYRGVPIIRSNHMNDAVILLVGVKNKHFNIGYSYDFTTSGLISSTGGSHEISIAYTFNQPERRRMPKKMVPCPEF